MSSSSSPHFWGGGHPIPSSLMGSRTATPPPIYDDIPSSSASAIGVTRSRTLLFLSYRDSVPRSNSSSRRAGSSLPSLTDRYADDPLGAAASSSSRNGTSDPKGKRKADGAYYDASTQEGGGEEDDSDTAALLRRDAHAIDIPALPPRWVDVSDEVDGILNDLQPKITQLDRLHAKHLLPGFVDRTKEERDIEKLSGEITKEFRRCSKLISSLASSTQGLIRSGKASSHEIAMAQNVQTALAQRVQSTSGQFRKKQSNYMQRLKGQDIRHQEVLGTLGLTRPGSAQAANKPQGGILRDEELAVREDMELSKQQLQSSQQSQSQSQLLLEAEENASPTHQDAEIARRTDEISHIAESIIQLSTLFQDLQSLVITQGTLIDRIDYNIETMGQNMQVAVQELNTASQTQRRTGRGQCILLLILLCALLITIIIVKPFWRFFFGSSTAAGGGAVNAVANTNPAVALGGGMPGFSMVMTVR